MSISYLILGRSVESSSGDGTIPGPLGGILKFFGIGSSGLRLGALLGGNQPDFLNSNPKNQ